MSKFPGNANGHVLQVAAHWSVESNALVCTLSSQICGCKCTLLFERDSFEADKSHVRQVRANARFQNMLFDAVTDSETADCIALQTTPLDRARTMASLVVSLNAALNDAPCEVRTGFIGSLLAQLTDEAAPYWARGASWQPE